MRAARKLAQSLLWIALAGVSASELALLAWALLATGGPALGPTAAAGAFAGMLAFNGVLVLSARRSRSVRRSWLFRRGYVLFSLGALASGGLLIAVFFALHTLAAWNPELVSDRWLLLGGAGSTSVALGLLAYSLTLGQRRIAVERVAVPIPGLAPALVGMRLAHISDLHIGPNLRASQIRRLVDRVNATQPDLILITGDIFDYDPNYIEEGCRELDKLWAPHGVFAVLGNHDVYTGADKVAEGIASLTSIRLLRDDFVRLEIAGATFHVAGIDDPGHSLADRSLESSALERLGRQLADCPDRMLLVHRPNYFCQIERLGFPLALAGHTHGGQVSPPRPVHHWNVARLMTPWTRGLFTRGGTHLYVNRGLGVGGVAMRFNCPREIAILTLE